MSGITRYVYRSRLILVLFALSTLVVVSGIALASKVIGFEQDQISDVDGMDVVPEIIHDPSAVSVKPENWVDYPHPTRLVGPLDEASEVVAPGRIKFYAYPKFYRTQEGGLKEVNTKIVGSNDPDWDYEVTEGIWTLKIREDGIFQAIHEGDIFTYRLQSLGIGSGDSYNPLDLGKPNWESIAVLGNTVKWTDVYPDIDLSIHYIHDILKIDVVLKNTFRENLRKSVAQSLLDGNDYVTARFEIPELLLTSQAKEDGIVLDLNREIDHQSVQFEKDGRPIHTLRQADAYRIDDQQEPIRGELIRTAQNWHLRQNGTGFAELSANIQDMVDLPEGDIVIDPSTIFHFCAKDTLLDKSNPNTTTGPSSILYFTSEDHLLSAWNISEEQLSSNLDITSVTLKLYVNSISAGFSNSVRIHQVPEIWEESCTWNNRLITPLTSWTNAGAINLSSLPTAGGTSTLNTTGWFSIDVTTPFTNYFSSNRSDILDKGFVLRMLSTSTPGQAAILSKEYADTSLRPDLEVVYATVSSVAISPDEAYSPERLYAPSYGGNRTRTIIAQISPAVAGVTVNFSVYDPDDLATDVAIDSSGGDWDNVSDSYSLSSSSAVTDANGQASVVFTASNKIGGNNYKVQAEVSGTGVYSPEMVVWRKLRIEYDAMANAPAADDTQAGLGHTIHDNYLNGLTHGLGVIYTDTSNNYNRCTFTTPVVASSPPESNTTYYQYLPTETDRDNYHSSTVTRDGSPYYEKLHMIVAHQESSTFQPGGRANGIPSYYFTIYWDKLQYDTYYKYSEYILLDAGTYDKCFIPAHEIGHCVGQSHHTSHGVDDVAGLPGHDCIMTQGPSDPYALNYDGQSTKRFGPACVRDIRNETYYIIE